MTEIELLVRRLAAMGRTPHQIEVELGFTPYTIHQRYHAALMAGYETRARRGENSTTANQQKEKQNVN